MHKGPILTIVITVCLMLLLIAACALLEQPPQTQPTDTLTEPRITIDIGEILPYSDYYAPLVRDSAIIPGLEVTDWERGTLTCPRCGHQMSNIPHGAEAVCPSCELRMQRWGNALHIWDR